MRFPQQFKNWLFNTPGIADTARFGTLAEKAAARADAAAPEAGLAEAGNILRQMRGDDSPNWSGQPLEDYLFAARILAEESLGMTLFNTQLLAAATMLQGTVVEMDTGEGKTLVGALVAGAHALTGRRVHVLTVNDYLAQRDAAWMGPYFDKLGVTAASVTANSTREEKKLAYGADVVYVSVNELGFDVLRDRSRTSPEQAVLQDFDVCIVDEIDSVLVDEAVVPLVLAGRARTELQGVDVADFVSSLDPDTDYTVEPDRRNVSLSDAGINKAEARWPGVELYSAAGTPLFSSINVALHAQVLLERDVDYIVRDGQAQIVSDSRGRVAHTQRWPDGLQAAVETKEGLHKTEQGEVLDQLLVRDLIKQFATVTGMSGTAVAVAEYLRTHYLLDAGRIPPHVPSIRRDLPEHIYATAEQRDAAVVEAVSAAHATGQPVLLGTHSVSASERFAAALTARDVECQVLNARNDALEAEVIAQAGRKNAVTVSTQMAGRGTDILLGGRDAGAGEHQEVAELGGLLVVIAGRFYSARLDGQLKGRAGRQGDPGASVIYSSVEDPAANGQEAHGLELSASVAGDADDDGLLNRAGMDGLLDRAQRLAEQERFTTQENSWKYNELIAYQRRVVLAERDRVLAEDAAALAPFDGAERWDEFRAALGDGELVRVCRQLMLFHLDAHWSDHLALLSEQRAAIHLRALGRQNPLDEFRRETILAFEGFLDRAADSARESFDGLELAGGTVDLEAAGIRRASSTWTYVVNEDPFGSQSDAIVKWLLKKMGK
ncbi:preprotein translocase subunit SecA [Arthrobacter silviterrae]|uniref:Protein translocase subunit SecA n=1 Tax=Arthrobacter silviterrae TaxID=2026658 RepID=A0ABX0DHK5_9MICC|nr:accessory Sec system translocase SecA2 [Arthrobacter silviterrae]MDQ0277841.1 preprotein translocase subunit SecA [Arthrobacter silviterrae]NGN83793.1 accessory Sec system translocase SecA2 [Arthrobacter silviterrae]